MRSAETERGKRGGAERVREPKGSKSASEEKEKEYGRRKDERVKGKGYTYSS